VLDWDPKQSHTFLPMSIVAKRLDGSRCHLVQRQASPRPLCQMGTHPPPKKGYSSPLMSGSCLLWPNGWMDQDATSYGARSWPRRHCVRWGPSSATERCTAAPHFLAHFARSPISATAEFLILVLQCCEWALPLSFPVPNSTSHPLAASVATSYDLT